MPRKSFNWKFVVIFLAIIAASGFGLYKLWQSNTQKQIEQGYTLGNKAYEEGNWLLAATEIGKYIAHNKNDVEMFLKYADAQLNIRPQKANNVKQAVASYRNVLRIEPGNVTAANRLIDIFSAQLEFGEAELIAQRAIEETKSPEIIIKYAKIFVRMRYYEKAYKVLIELIKDHPDNAQAYELLAYIADQDPVLSTESPEHWVKQAFDELPDHAMPYIIRGSRTARLNEIEDAKTQAINDFNLARTKTFKSDQERLRLAGEFIATNQLQSAKEILDNLLENPSPESLESPLLIWIVYKDYAIHSKSKDEMLRIAEQGLKADPKKPWSFMSMAIELYIEADAYDLAHKYINILQEKEINIPKMSYYEGEIAFRQQNFNEAIANWRKADNLGYTSPDLQLKLAQALNMVNDPLTAIQILTNLSSKYPEHAYIHLDCARSYIQTKQWNLALEYARKARMILPNNLEAFIMYAQAKSKTLEETEIPATSLEWTNLAKEVNEKQNNNPDNPQLCVVQFQIELYKKDYTKAQGIVDQMKTKFPDDIQTALIDIELTYRKETFEVTYNLLLNYIEKFQDNIQPIKSLAILLVKDKRYDEAFIALKDAIEKNKDNIANHKELSLLLADAYNMASEQDLRFELLSSLANTYPEDITIKRQILMTPHSIENTELSQTIVDQIRALEGEQGWQWKYEQAKVWFMSDQFNSKYQNIISTMKDIVKTYPTNISCRLLLAATYEKGKDNTLALATYREAYERTPDNISVIIPYIKALKKNNDEELASEITIRAAQANISHPALTNIQLENAMRQGKIQASVNLLEQQAKESPENKEILLMLARLKTQQGLYTEADVLLSKIPMTDENYSDIMLSKIDLNLNQKDFESATQLANQLVNKLNDYSSYLIRARIYAAQNDDENEAKDIEKAFQLAPNEPSVWIDKAKMIYNKGNLPEAIATIEKALDIDKDNIDVKRVAISLYLQTADENTRQKAITMLDKEIEANPQDMDFKLTKAKYLLTLGSVENTQKAITLLQEITKNAPQFGEAWLILGRIALSENNTYRALSLANSGLESSPKNKDLLLMKAQAESVNSPTKSINTLETIRQMDPDDMLIVAFLASNLSENNKTDQALDLLKKQTPKTPEDQKIIQLAIAQTYYKAKNYDIAQKMFNDMHKLNPEDPSPLYTYASLLINDKNWPALITKIKDWQSTYSDAETLCFSIANSTFQMKPQTLTKLKAVDELLTFMISKYPENLDVLKLTSIVYLQTNKISEAKEINKKILAVAPESIESLNNLAWIYCENDNNYTAALELANKGVNLRPDFLDIIDTRGVIYYRMGEYEKAINDFNEFITISNPDNSALTSTYFHLGRSYAKTGQKAEAIDMINKSLQMNKNPKMNNLTESDLEEAKQLLIELQQ